MKELLCIVKAAKNEDRARRLASGVDMNATFCVRQPGEPLLNFALRVNKVMGSNSWDLVYLEGTGIAAGANSLLYHWWKGQKYIVSSGDPIAGFFTVTRGSLVGAMFGIYERLLYRACSGFIGWTPYLVGAALNLGARRAVTIEGAVDTSIFHPYSQEKKRAAKASLGIQPDQLVCGVVGILKWVARQSYCYGLELVQALKLVRRKDITILVVGDGDGQQILENSIPESLRSQVVFTGRLQDTQLANAINAMDLGFVTQTLDELGLFRLTGKLPEYLACGVPVAMSCIPGYYDYAMDVGWALPPKHPGSKDFQAKLARWLDELTFDEVQTKATGARSLALQRFDYTCARNKFRVFVESVIELPPGGESA